MPKYVKKPVVIDAVQFISLDHNKFEVVEFFKGSTFDARFNYDNGNIEIDTLEGTMSASPGDYIIKGVKGEFYPCKPDIFEMTYEAIVPLQPAPLDEEDLKILAKLEREHRHCSCCDNEKRNMDGGCDNCGDPCY